MTNDNTKPAGDDNDIDVEILKEFQLESQALTEQMLEILESIEGDFSQVKRLEEYGQTVDRIMGGAKSLAMSTTNAEHAIHKIGDYSALCKAVGYKASQIKNNSGFYDICVALLLDATELLEEMINSITENKPKEVKQLLSKTFLDRLRWVSNQFSAEYRASVEVKENNAPKKLGQSEIDDILAKLGL